MILLCGIPTESPLERVIAAVEEAGSPYAVFNQRHAAATDLRCELDGAGLSGEIAIDGRRLALAEVTGVYLRLMDDRLLPELADEPPRSAARERCRRLHDALIEWCEITPARVLNRAAAMASNSSKPYQAQLIREHGLSIPDTLITNDPDLVRDFLDLHRKVIYKSVSGVRSVVRTLGEEDLSRLDHIRWCPTQFQAWVGGTDVRVHTVGGEVFATAVESAATDYRYARREGGETELAEVELDDETAERCVRLAAALGLDFAGIDLRVTPDGEAFCFEVNPCPAYSYYESHTGQPIAAAVARYLAGQG